MALAQETPLLLLDEPTTYLDLAHQIEVLDLLHRLNEEEGRTIVLVIHDLNLACRYVDHLVAMADGRIRSWAGQRRRQRGHGPGGLRRRMPHPARPGVGRAHGPSGRPAGPRP